MSIAELDQLWTEVMSIAHRSSGGPELIFRGVTDQSHELIPSLGRRTSVNTGGDIESLEDRLLEEFRRLTIPILKTPPASDFEWLFLAQHYGLPTRLLDWSTNPLVALYFATERRDDVDGALYYLQHAVTDQYDLIDYRTATYTKKAGAAPASIFALQPGQGTVIFVRPRYVDERYINQRSVFSCPKDPFVALDAPGLQKVVIPGNYKHEFRKRLRVLGISTSYIYPGLAGVASEVKSHVFDPVAAGRLVMMTFRTELKLGPNAP